MRCHADSRLGWLALILLFAACADEKLAELQSTLSSEPTGEGELLSSQPALEIADPQSVIRGPYTAEALAGEVGDLLTEFADRVLVRDIEGIGPHLTGNFLGHPLGGAACGPEESLPLGTVRYELESQAIPGVDGEGWLGDLSALVSNWNQMTQAELHVQEAEFERGDPSPYGVVVFRMQLAGITLDGRHEAHARRVRGAFRRVEGEWKLERAIVEAGYNIHRKGTGFVEVTQSTGVQHQGPNFGQPGNNREGWNGAAVADVNGDGRLDVFVPNAMRGYLYLNQADGTFLEAAEECGLRGTGGGTGLVFADFDRDGDQDLVLAGIGWNRLGEIGGDPLRAFENDGEGHFTEVTDQAGMGSPMPALGLVAADFDGDGHLDLFVAGYGRMEVARNDNWIQATNGAPDRLLLGLGGLAFRDGTKDAGLHDRDWTASALAADLDQDGDMDLVTLNHFGVNRFWRNQGGGTFERDDEAFGSSEARLTFGGTLGDFDQDGFLDLYLAGASSGTGRRMFSRMESSGNGDVSHSLRGLAQGNHLLRGTPSGFETVIGAAGAGSAGWAWGTVAADFDLDGRLDLACANGFVTGDLPEDT
jgi:hypothetical protein